MAKQILIKILTVSLLLGLPANSVEELFFTTEIFFDSFANFDQDFACRCLQGGNLAYTLQLKNTCTFIAINCNCKQITNIVTGVLAICSHRGCDLLEFCL